jgi:hypothetical protein
MGDPMRERGRRKNFTRRDYPAGLPGAAIWGLVILGLAILAAGPLLIAQEAPQAQTLQVPQAQTPQVPQASEAPPAAESTQTPPVADVETQPIAIIPLDSKIPGAAAEVTGALKVYNGRAFISANGAVTSGSETTLVTLPYRGTLRICASTTVNLAIGSKVPAGEIPGLMMAMDHGAVEASFATGRDSDFLITPDFRILIGGPGAANVNVRLARNGDTCVDNAGVNAPYVLVSSVFDGGAYRVQSGQRVMFQHGSIHEVVDQEKEPCGCPPAAKGANEFPLAQSEGLAPTLHPVPIPTEQVGHETQTTATLTYNSAEHAPKPVEAAQPAATQQAGAPAAPAAKPPAKQKKPGFFRHVGNFFRKVFGAD